ncbi:MAG: endonuclease III [Candidatus Bathyarchaeia archaeon]
MGKYNKKLPLALIETIEKRYGKYWWSGEEEKRFKEILKDPFKNLIFTILSQNTSGENTHKAYSSLSSKFSIDPYTLAKSDEKEISESIKPGGLHRIKARRIKEVSKYILDKFSGSLEKILSLPKEDAKNVLKQMPGVGDKTADVLLSSIYGYRESLVIDTHMARIAKRLGLVPKNAKYEEIQKSLKEFIPWDSIPSEKWDRTFSLIWLLAKNTCEAKNPKCEGCVLAKVCGKRVH